MTIRNAVLATLAYHDIFDYPLTQEEINRFLAGETVDAKKVEKVIDSLIKDKKIEGKNSYYFLKGRGKIFKLRAARKKYSTQKLKRAKLFAKLLMIIPTVKLIAVSGALAMENAQKNDDIDLVIVTAKNTLWSTRLLANTILQPYRRKAGEPHTKDKACLNLFLEESSLKIRTQNLYTAHEVAQMRPLWQRENTYNRFLKANTWVKNYLPNWEGEPSDSAFSFPQLGITQTFEKLTKALQLFYMKPKITTEKIGEHQLFFHPNDTENQVLKSYIKKLSKFT